MRIPLTLASLCLIPCAYADSTLSIIGISTTGYVQSAGISTTNVSATNITVGGIPVVPTGAIMAFDLASCPTGWTEYTAARGRFLRGIDNGAGNDPDGTRASGATQADAFQGHTFSVSAFEWTIPTVGTGGSVAYTRNSNANDGSQPLPFITGPNTDGTNGTPRTAAETRPKNVAVLYCRKN